MAAARVAQEIGQQVRVVGAAPQVVVRVADGKIGIQRRFVHGAAGGAGHGGPPRLTVARTALGSLVHKGLLSTDEPAPAE